MDPTTYTRSLMTAFTTATAMLKVIKSSAIDVERCMLDIQTLLWHQRYTCSAKKLRVSGAGTLVAMLFSGKRESSPTEFETG